MGGSKRKCRSTRGRCQVGMASMPRCWLSTLQSRRMPYLTGLRRPDRAADPRAADVTAPQSICTSKFAAAARCRHSRTPSADIAIPIHRTPTAGDVLDMHLRRICFRAPALRRCELMSAPAADVPRARTPSGCTHRTPVQQCSLCCRQERLPRPWGRRHPDGMHQRRHRVC